MCSLIASNGWQIKLQYLFQQWWLIENIDPFEAEVHSKELAVKEMGVYTKRFMSGLGMQEAWVVVKI